MNTTEVQHQITAIHPTACIEEVQHLYFITISVWQPKNKLQQAIQASIQEYQHQILHSSPESLINEVCQTIARLNTIHARCRPEIITKYNIGQDEPITFRIGDYTAQLTLTPVKGEITISDNL